MKFSQLFILVLFTTASFAQKTELPFVMRNATKFDTPKDIMAPHFEYDEENEALIGFGFSRKQKELFVYQIDPYNGQTRQIAELSTKKLEYKREDAWYANWGDANGEAFYIYQGVAKVLYYSYNKRDDERYLLSMDIDLRTGRVSPFKVLWTQAEARGADGFIRFEVSEDKSKILVASSASTQDREHAMLTVGVIDWDGEVEWKACLDLETENEFIDFEAISFDKQGRVIVSVEETKLGRDRTERFITYFHRFNRAGDSFETAFFDNEIMPSIEATVGYYATLSRENGDLVLAGAYGTQKAKTFSGAFSMIIDGESWEAQEPYLMALSNEVQEQFDIGHAEISQKEEQEGFKNVRMTVRWFDEADNGELDLVLEDFNYSKYTYYDGSAYRTSYRVAAQNVVVVRFDANGKPLWMTGVPKIQFTDTPNVYSSTAGTEVIKHDDGIGLFYLDHHKNFMDFPYITKKYAPGLKAQLVYVHVDGSGNAAIERMHGDKDYDKIVLSPRHFRTFGENDEFLLMPPIYANKFGGLIIQKD